MSGHTPLSISPIILRQVTPLTIFGSISYKDFAFLAQLGHTLAQVRHGGGEK
jgi:hypothetical protein